jgi:phosphomannomutase
MVTSVLHDIVKSYDVRGLVETQLSPAVARALGSAFVDVVVGSGNAMVVGHDMRESSPVLAQAFMEGATQRGADVRYIGLSSTDMVYFASGSWDIPSAMFTASHNPARYNGIKFSRRSAQGVSLHTGLAEIRDRAQEYLEGTVESSLGTPGQISTDDVLYAYAKYLRDLVALEGVRPLRVVVDAANGMAGHTVPAVLGAASGLDTIEIIPMFFELDGSFPNHEANPLEPANLIDIQRAVIAEHADIGLAFDGDADRCFVIDEKGQPVTPSAVAALVAQREIRRVTALGEAGPLKVIHNLICSRTVAEVIVENGATPVRTRVGHSFIKDQMKQTGAIFGGEHSAHYYFRDFWGADNGMLAALHVLAELGSNEAPLSQVVSDFSRYFSSGEINSVVSDPAWTMETIAAEFATHGDHDTLDGLSVQGRDPEGIWWFNVRASNTEPLLRLNVEAATQASMEALRDRILSIIRG